LAISGPHSLRRGNREFQREQDREPGKTGGHKLDVKHLTVRANEQRAGQAEAQAAL